MFLQMNRELPTCEKKVRKKRKRGFAVEGNDLLFQGIPVARNKTLYEKSGVRGFRNKPLSATLILDKCLFCPGARAFINCLQFLVLTFLFNYGIIKAEKERRIKNDDSKRPYRRIEKV